MTTTDLHEATVAAHKHHDLLAASLSGQLSGKASEADVIEKTRELVMARDRLTEIHRSHADLSVRRLRTICLSTQWATVGLLLPAMIAGLLSWHVSFVIMLIQAACAGTLWFNDAGLDARHRAAVILMSVTCFLTGLVAASFLTEWLLILTVPVWVAGVMIWFRATPPMNRRWFG